MTELRWDDIAESFDFLGVLAELGIDVKDVVRGEHFASCPLPSHPGADTNPSFSVNENTCLWNCFTCATGGLLPSLVMEIVGFESDEASSAWQKSVDWLAQFSDVSPDSDHLLVEQLERAFARAEERPKRERRSTLPVFTSRALDGLKKAPIELFEKWGIDMQVVVDKFDIRYDPKRVKMNDKGHYEGPALVIPHYFGGKLVGFQERWMNEDRPKWLGKYTNSSGFPKKETLFNWDVAVEYAALPEAPAIIVVESIMTVVRLLNMGIIAVATFGASVSDEQIQLLSSLSSVVLAFDNDAAGRMARHEVGEKLSELTAVETLPILKEAKQDLADLPDDQINAILLLKMPFTPGRSAPLRSG